MDFLDIYNSPIRVPERVEFFRSLLPTTAEEVIEECRIYFTMFLQCLSNSRPTDKIVEALAHLRYRAIRLGLQPVDDRFITFYENCVPMLIWSKEEGYLYTSIHQLSGFDTSEDAVPVQDDVLKPSDTEPLPSDEQSVLVDSVSPDHKTSDSLSSIYCEHSDAVSKRRRRKRKRHQPDHLQIVKVEHIESRPAHNLDGCDIFSTPIEQLRSRPTSKFHIYYYFTSQKEEWTRPIVIRAGVRHCLQRLRILSHVSGNSFFRTIDCGDLRLIPPSIHQ